MHIYTAFYNKEGYLKDSIVFKNNVRISKESLEYNSENKIIKRALYDSSENLVNVLERDFDENGKEINFKAFKSDTLRYSQKSFMEKIIN